MKLICGLGNIGEEYACTRHNIGFMFIDKVSEYYGFDFKTDKNLKCMIKKVTINGTDCVFIKPTTYMNLSGEAVRSVKDFYKINDEDVLIIHDDMDLPCGKLRLRANGSAGGQNGMKNIIQHLGHQNIKRIRVGIDKGNDAVNHVLGKFKSDERVLIDEVLYKAPNIINDYLEMTFENLMNKYNK